MNRMIVNHNGQEVQRGSTISTQSDQVIDQDAEAQQGVVKDDLTTEQPKPETSGNLDSATGETPTTEEGGETTQPQSASSRIPINAEGQPDYLQAQPQDSYDALVEDLGEDDANSIVESEISDAQKRLQRLEKQQPKGANIEEKKQNLAERRKAMEAEKAKIDYWNSVLEIPKTRKAEAERKAEEEEERRRVESERKAKMQTSIGRQQLLEEAKNNQERAAIAKEIYGDYFNENIGEPDTAEELVSLLLPYGQLNWEGFDRGGRHVRGLQEELGSGFTRGLAKDRGTSAFNSYLAKKGEGKSLDDIVHSMYENDANISGEGHRFTTEEIKDAAIGMLLSAEKPTDIRDYALNSRIDMAERTLRAELEAEMEAWAEAYHLTPEERETYEDFMSQAPEIPNDPEFINQIIELNYTDEEQNSRGQEVDLDNTSGTAGTDSEGGESQVQGQGAAETAGADQEQQRPEQGAETPSGEQAVSGDNVPGGTPEPAIRPLLWDGSAETPTTDTATEPVTSRDAQQGGEQSGSASGQSGLSEGKDTNNPANLQEKTERTSDLGATSSPEQIAEEENRVDTNPSDAQKEAGNYQKGHIKIDGLDITIENPKGSVRRGTDADGNAWETTMHNTYGYIRGTEATDGDHLDVFLSDDPASGNVFVVDQVDPKTGKFDEVKIMIGFTDAAEATEAYLSNYEKDWKGLGAITGVSREDFKEWVESSHRKTKPFADYALAKKKGIVDDHKADGEALSPDSQEKALRDAVVDHLRSIGVEVSTDWQEGQRILDEYNGNGPIKKMGQKTNKKKAQIAADLEGNELTPEQQAVVDVFTGKSNNSTLSFTRDGKQRRVIMRKGNEVRAGAEHSLFRHYGTTEGVISSEDVLRIPDVLETGERTPVKRGKTQLYEYTLTDANGVKYTVVTENKHGREEFADFYTNKKGDISRTSTPSEEARASDTDNALKEASSSLASNTPKGAHSFDDSASSGAKVQQNPETNKDSVEKFFKTPDGYAYGYTYNGRIYIDPSIATSETPIHEYTHLWAEALRQKDPEQWENIVDVLVVIC